MALGDASAKTRGGRNVSRKNRTGGAWLDSLKTEIAEIRAQLHEQKVKAGASSSTAAGPAHPRHPAEHDLPRPEEPEPELEAGSPVAASIGAWASINKDAPRTESSARQRRASAPNFRRSLSADQGIAAMMHSRRSTLSPQRRSISQLPTAGAAAADVGTGRSVDGIAVRPGPQGPEWFDDGSGASETQAMQPKKYPRSVSPSFGRDLAWPGDITNMRGIRWSGWTAEQRPRLHVEGSPMIYNWAESANRLHHSAASTWSLDQTQRTSPQQWGNRGNYMGVSRRIDGKPARSRSGSLERASPAAWNQSVSESDSIYEPVLRKAPRPIPFTQHRLFGERQRSESLQAVVDTPTGFDAWGDHRRDLVAGSGAALCGRAEARPKDAGFSFGKSPRGAADWRSLACELNIRKDAELKAKGLPSNAGDQSRHLRTCMRSASTGSSSSPAPRSH